MQENFDTPKRCRYINSQDHNEIPSPKETGSALHQLQTEKKDLIKIIQEREDSLRKLNLVKMYRNKVSKEQIDTHWQNTYKEI